MNAPLFSTTPTRVPITTPAGLRMARELALPIVRTGHPFDDDRVVSPDEALRVLESHSADLHVNSYPAAE